MANINGRIARLENQKQAVTVRGLSPETNRYIEAMLTLAYSPAGAHDLPDPGELEALEVASQALDPQFWNTLNRVYGGNDNG